MRAQDIAELIGVQAPTKGVLLAALIGGLISMQWMHDMSKKQKAMALASGMAMSAYVAEPLADTFANGKFTGVLGLLIGLFGMSVCGLIFKMMDGVTVTDVLGMFERLASRLIDGILSKFPTKEDGHD